MKIIKTSKNKKLSFLFEVIKMFFKCGVLESSAVLSFYIFFSIFPLIIITNYFSFEVSFFETQIGSVILQFIPLQIRELAASYIEELPYTATSGFSVVSIFLFISSITRVTVTLKRKIRLFFPHGSVSTPLKEWIVSALFTVLVLLCFFFIVPILVFWDKILLFANDHLAISEVVSRLFFILRLFLCGGFIFLVFLGLYHYLPAIRMPVKKSVPGALFSTFCWIVLSLLFAFYVENMNDYSLIYGSLGTVIVLLSWLYLTNAVLLLGAVINSVYTNFKK